LAAAAFAFASAIICAGECGIALPFRLVGNLYRSLRSRSTGDLLRSSCAVSRSGCCACNQDSAFSFLSRCFPLLVSQCGGGQSSDSSFAQCSSTASVFVCEFHIPFLRIFDWPNALQSQSLLTDSEHQPVSSRIARIFEALEWPSCNRCRCSSSKFSLRQRIRAARSIFDCFIDVGYAFS